MSRINFCKTLRKWEIATKASTFKKGGSVWFGYFDELVEIANSLLM